MCGLVILVCSLQHNFIPNTNSLILILANIEMLLTHLVVAFTAIISAINACPYANKKELQHLRGHHGKFQQRFVTFPVQSS